MVGLKDVRTMKITKYSKSYFGITELVRTMKITKYSKSNFGITELLTSNLDGVTFRVVVAPLEEQLSLLQCHTDDVGQQSNTDRKQLS